MSNLQNRKTEHVSNTVNHGENQKSLTTRVYEELPVEQANDSHCLKEKPSQVSFFSTREKEIIEAWEKHIGLKGYLELYVREDYYTYTVEFIEKKIKMSDFLHIPCEEGTKLIFLNMLWYDTKTKYKIALPYNPIERRIWSENRFIDVKP
jgi:hypothetical protein